MTTALIIAKEFPKVGTIVLMPKICPGNDEHEAHGYMSHGLIERVEEDRHFVIARDDADFETHKIFVKIEN